MVSSEGLTGEDPRPSSLFVGRIQSLMSCDLLVSVFPYLLLRVALLSVMRSFSQVRSHNGSWLPSERIREERG